MARRRPPSGLGPWLVVPALGLLGLFVFWPLLRTIDLSGYASNLLGNPTRFVGLGNYAALLGSHAFVRTVIVSIAIALLSMVAATTSALTAALLLRRRIAGRGVFDILFSLPFAYSAASSAAVFAGLFAPAIGSVNAILGGLGLPRPDWLGNSVPAVCAVVIATAWYDFGFAFLVLTAAVRTVSPEILEAAELEGANGRQLATRVVIPSILPSLAFLAITQTISGLQIFAQIQVLTNGGPGGATTNFVYDLYQLAFGNGTPDFGRASVVAVTLVVFVAVVTTVQMRLLRRGVTA